MTSKVSHQIPWLFYHTRMAWRGRTEERYACQNGPIKAIRSFGRAFAGQYGGKLGMVGAFFKSYQTQVIAVDTLCFALVILLTALPVAGAFVPGSPVKSLLLDTKLIGNPAWNSALLGCIAMTPANVVAVLGLLTVTAIVGTHFAIGLIKERNS